MLLGKLFYVLYKLHYKLYNIGGICKYDKWNIKLFKVCDSIAVERDMCAYICSFPDSMPYCHCESIWLTQNLPLSLKQPPVVQGRVSSRSKQSQECPLEDPRSSTCSPMPPSLYLKTHHYDLEEHWA